MNQRTYKGNTKEEICAFKRKNEEEEGSWCPNCGSRYGLNDEDDAEEEEFEDKSETVTCESTDGLDNEELDSCSDNVVDEKANVDEAIMPMEEQEVVSK